MAASVLLAGLREEPAPLSVRCMIQTHFKATLHADYRVPVDFRCSVSSELSDPLFGFSAWRILVLIAGSSAVAIGNEATRWQDIGAKLGNTVLSHRMNPLRKPAAAFMRCTMNKYGLIETRPAGLLRENGVELRCNGHWYC